MFGCTLLEAVGFITRENSVGKDVHLKPCRSLNLPVPGSAWDLVLGCSQFASLLSALFCNTAALCQERQTWVVFSSCIQFASWLIAGRAGKEQRSGIEERWRGAAGRMGKRPEQHVGTQVRDGTLPFHSRCTRGKCVIGGYGLGKRQLWVFLHVLVATVINFSGPTELN